VYLHYRQSDRRELVIHRGSAEEGKMVPYQAFIQFLRAFVPNPPSWIREGFAIYFSTLTVAENGEPVYEENLSWLDTVKGLGEKALSPEAILMADQRGFPQEFQSLSWALVSFFLGSGKEEYFRTMTESFLLLSSTATAAENSEVLTRRISLWNPLDTLSKDFQNYLASRKTFTELIAEGQRAYAARDPVGAEFAFLGALDQKPAHYAPYYYLGLLAYEEGSVDMAEQYYLSALRYGADEALVSYALGVNAASAGKTREAIDYLRRAAAVSPERYREKSDSLIQRLR
jgi:tetratricopeptide (TPR) repeat protein